MPDFNPSNAGFSSGRRWMAALNLAIASIALLAVLVMVNYLSQGHYRRVPVANATRFNLSDRTRSVLAALTNDVRITIFYQRRADVYAMVTSLLQEYKNANPAHIDVKALDPDRSPRQAQNLLNRLHLGSNQNDFVAFECDGQHQIISDSKLSHYDLKDIMKTRVVRRDQFLGELYFTSAIFAVSHPSNLKAYFLAGHGERDPNGSADQLFSDAKLAAILKDELSCSWTNLILSETDSIPADCSLLIIASGGECHNLLSPNELSHIQTYLQHNGRLLALLDVTEGLDPVLSNWDISVGAIHVRDQDPSVAINQLEFRVYPALDTNSATVHPIMLPLAREGFYLRMVDPHPVFSAFPTERPDPGAATFTAIAASTTNSTPLASEIKPSNATPRSYPLVAAVEKNVVTEHDGTRILVAGDSDFLSDLRIDSSSGDNHQFASLALDWLLQRPSVVTSSISPRPITEYTISLTERQTTQVRWLFLAAMPGSILFLGGLVWLRRRK